MNYQYPGILKTETFSKPKGKDPNVKEYLRWLFSCFKDKNIKMVVINRK